MRTVGVTRDGYRLRPGQPAIGADGLVNSPRAGYGPGRRASGVRIRAAVDVSPVVVKQGHIVAVFKPFDGRHSDDAPEIADGFERCPGAAVVLRDGHSDWVKSGEHNQPFDAVSVNDAMNCGDLFGCRPVFGGGQAAGPGQAGVRAALHHDCAGAVALGIDGYDRSVVFEQDGSGVAEVLAGLFVNYDLPAGVF